VPTEERATGIILRTHPLTESSLIVRWLTGEAGRIDTAARGARGAKSPMRGRLDLFYLAQFSFARSRRSELHTLREVTLLNTHRSLRTRLGALRQASYASCLILQTTEPGMPLPELFELAKGFLSCLAEVGPTPLLLLAFEINLLEVLGQQPRVADSRLSAPARRLFETCSSSDWPEVCRQQPQAAPLHELSRFLHRWLVEQVGQIPKERATALDLPPIASPPDQSQSLATTGS
jgi:DNA repair protein RecO (recombination protein O)